MLYSIPSICVFDHASELTYITVCNELTTIHTCPCIRVCVGRGHYQIRPRHSYSVNPDPVEGQSALNCCEHPAHASLYSEEADTCVKSSKQGIIPRFVLLCEILFETRTIFSQ